MGGPFDPPPPLDVRGLKTYSYTRQYLLSLYHYCKECYFFSCTLLSPANANNEVMKLHFEFRVVKQQVRNR